MFADNLKVNTPAGFSNVLYYRVDFSERSDKFVKLSFMFVSLLDSPAQNKFHSLLSGIY